MEQTNIGIVLGTALLLVGLCAAVAAYCLSRVRRAQERAAASGEPSAEGWAAYYSWLRPLMLFGSGVLLLCAGVRLWEGYTAGSGWKAVEALGLLMMGCSGFVAWRNLRRTAEPGAAPDRGGR